MHIWSVTNDHVYTSYSFYQFGFCSANQAMYKYVISISKYVCVIRSAPWKINLQDGKHICTLVWKSKFFFLSIQSYCIFSFLNQWECSNVSWVRFTLKKVFLFHVAFDTKGPLHKLCDCFSFSLCHLLYDNTFFFYLGFFTNIYDSQDSRGRRRVCI